MPRRLEHSVAPLVIAAPMAIEAWAVGRGLRSVEHGAGIEVVRTGMRAGRARKAALRLRSMRAEAIAIAGLAGSADAAVVPGDVVVASELRGPDGGCIALQADPLVGPLEALGLRVHRGAIAGVDHIVRGAERESLRQRGVMAVDMESYWLAQGCMAGPVQRPMACLRVIVDAPGHEIASPATLSRGARALAVLSRAVSILPEWAMQQGAGARLRMTNRTVPAEASAEPAV